MMKSTQGGITVSVIFSQPDQFTAGTNDDDTIYGTSGNDTIFAYDGNDIIYGDDGHDDVTGGAGNDYFEGGNGDDYFTPNAGLNTFIGGAGSDRISYADETRSIYVDLSETGFSEVFLDGILSDRISEVEQIVTGYGDDYVKFDNADFHHFFSMNGGNDTLIGGSREDMFSLSDFTGTYQLDGGLGDDWVLLGNALMEMEHEALDIDLRANTISIAGEIKVLFSSIEAFTTSSKDDVIRDDIDSKANYFFTLDGNDTFYAGVGVNTYQAGEGFDILDLSFSSKVAKNAKPFFDYQVVIADGTNFIEGVEKIVLTNFNDKFSIINQVLALDGGLGNDTLTGSKGNDSIAGGDGKDSIAGGDGNDYLEGGLHNDKINGGKGDDFLVGGEGNDTLTAGAGNDTIYGEGGNDVIVTTSGLDWVYGGEGNDRITGSKDSDKLEGDGGNDTIIGGAGNDALWGSDGDDVISGGSGSDHIWGGAGKDRLTGGTGIDRFHFGEQALSASNVDVITDFKGDDIYLYSDPFTNLQFISVNKLSQANSGEGIIYEKSTGTLYYDHDGAGSGEAAIAFVILIGKPTLTISNFSFDS